MKNILPIIIAVALSLFIGSFFFNKDGHKSTETAYDRIMQTQTIRCGYGLRPPFLYKDMSNNKLAGLGYDVTEEIGKRLSVKIEWTEELGFGTIVPSLVNGRIDMACGAYWPNSARARSINFTTPFALENVFVYQRASDSRNFIAYNELNNSAYSFGSIDGSTPALLQKRYFPNSISKSLPELAPSSETFEDLLNNKIDFVINPSPMASAYQKARPSSLKSVINEPLAAYPIVMFLPPNDMQLQTMINVALHEMILDGTLKELIKKNNLEQDLLQINPYK